MTERAVGSCGTPAPGKAHAPTQMCEPIEFDPILSAIIGPQLGNGASPFVDDNKIVDAAQQPAGYTFLGQFIDHDLTANTDRDDEVSNITKPDLAPLAPAFVVENLKNLRQPTVNLDSVYGDGPTFDATAPTQAGRMYDGIKLRVGKVASLPSLK